MLSYCDTHTHLLDPSFDADRSAVIDRARAAGVSAIIEVSDTVDAWDRARAFVTMHEHVYLSVGAHPHAADAFLASMNRQTLGEALVRVCTSPRVVAFGEIGLDFFRNRSTRENQCAALRMQLAAWRDTPLPLVLHARAVEQECVDILTEFLPHPARSGRQGVLHCFSGSLSFAQKMVSLGFVLGVDGPITYPKNDLLRHTIRQIGLANIVLETDSPYLPPQHVRGGRNEPGHLGAIATAVAALYGVSTETVADVTNRTAAEIFGVR